MKNKVLNLLANKLKDSIIWSVFNIDRPLAYRLDDGSIVIISLMETEKTKEIALFFGDNGLLNFRKSLQEVTEENILLIQDLVLSIENISIIYPTKEDYDDDLEGFFTSDEPVILYQSPYKVNFEELPEEQFKLTLDILKFLERLGELGEDITEITNRFYPIRNGRGIIPLFTEDNDEIQYKKYVLPRESEEEYLRPKVQNELQLARLSRLKSIGTIQIGLISSGESIKVGNDFHTPIMIFIVDESTGITFPFITETVYSQDPEKFLDEFIGRLLELKLLPKNLKVPDKRAYFFLQDLADKLGIKLEISKDLKELTEAESLYSQNLLIDNWDMDESLESLERLEDNDHPLVQSIIGETKQFFTSENLNDYKAIEEQFSMFLNDLYGNDSNYKDNKEDNNRSKLIYLENTVTVKIETSEEDYIFISVNIYDSIEEIIRYLAEYLEVESTELRPVLSSGSQLTFESITDLKAKTLQSMVWDKQYSFDLLYKDKVFKCTITEKFFSDEKDTNLLLSKGKLIK